MQIITDIQNWMENSIVDEIILIALVIAIVESFAQNTIKNSDNDSVKFILGISFYVIIGYILHYAYHKFPLGRLNVLWSCISIILAMFLGYMLYDEPLNYWNVLSLIFAIGAIYASYRSSD